MGTSRWMGAVAFAVALVLPGSASAASGWTVAATTGVTGPVSSFSDSDAWAVGNPGFAHWNGSAWQQVAAPAGRGTVLGIADDGPSDAWAVGSVSSGYHITSPQIERWDGRTWTVSAAPVISARNANLSGVAAPGPGNAWAVGNDGHAALIEHWDGTAWTRVTVPDPNAGTIYGSRLTAISARTASDIWAIGTYANPAPAPDSLYALHFDGTAWRQVAMAQTGSQTNSNSPVPTSVVAVGPADVWMVGQQSNFSSPTTLTEHWNGSRWSIVASPFDHLSSTSNSVAFGTLNTVTARASDDVWAGGYSFTFTDGDPQGVYHALLLHWNGTAWTQDNAPTTGTYNVIQGISTTPGSHRIWATNAGTPSLLSHS